MNAEITPFPSSSPESPSSDGGLQAAAWDALHYVIDPELGINLVDLGLIYDLRIEDGHASVIMTVTTPGCPMEHSLTFGVETALLAIEGVRSVDVRVAHEPPWSPAMMTPEGRAAAGIR